LNRLLEPLDLRGSFGATKNIVVKLSIPDGVPPEHPVCPHPGLVKALVEHLRELWPEAKIVVADGPAVERDTAYMLAISGLGDAIEEMPGVHFVDLNTAPFVVRPVSDGWTLKALAVPRIVEEADLFISLAKLKTHRWAGVTLTMKNLFGLLPGSVYGYPKNPLHWAGIARSISDIYATCPPDLCLIDGVGGMEGDGPLNGEARAAGALLAGFNGVAVDAVTTRLMGIEPGLVPQFWYASGEKPEKLRPVVIGDDVDRLRFAAPQTMPWLEGSADLDFGELLERLDTIPFVEPLR
jgi:uncharacterized protein (DUF362 family)